MYFTSTPSLNSMEIVMKRPPGGNQRGGGRLRKVYPFRKADCDCRHCLYYRKKKGCAMGICQVLDVRLSCGAASFYEAVHATFANARHMVFIVPLTASLVYISAIKSLLSLIFVIICVNQYDSDLKDIEILPQNVIILITRVETQGKAII